MQDTPSAILLGEMNSALMTIIVRLWEAENIPFTNNEKRSQVLNEAKGELRKFQLSCDSFQKLEMTSDEKKTLLTSSNLGRKLIPTS